MSESLGSAIFTVRGDDTQLQSMFRSIPRLVAQQGRATEQVATSVFGAAGAASGRAFSTSVVAGTSGIGATIGNVGRSAGAAFSTGLQSSTGGIGGSIANPLNGVPRIIQSIGASSGQLFTSGLLASTSTISNSIANPLGALQGIFGTNGSTSGRSFSTGVLGATSGLPSSIAQPLGVLPSSFAGVGGSAGRSFASAVASNLGSIAATARSAAAQMSAPFINAGRSIGQSVRGDIGRGIKYSVGSSVARAGTGLVGAAFDTKNLAEFDAASRKVAQLTSDTKGMEKAAAALSKELKYGTNSTEVLVASYDVLSSGFSKTTDVANILRPAIKATIASQGEAKLERVSDAITSVINSYKSWGYSAKDAEMIVNQMSGTVDAGKIKYGQYANLIGKAASVAASAGISFSDLNTAIAKATISGQKPGAVLAGIPGIIANISKPTKVAADTANALGIEFNATALKAKGLLGIMADIAAKTEKLGAAGRSEAIQKLFGSINGKNVATSLITDSGKSSDQTSVGNITKAVNSGSVDKNFNLASGGIKFQQDALKNRVIELDVKLKNGVFGEVLAASMAIAAKAIGGVITAVETLDNWYKKLDPSTQGLVKGIGTIAVGAIAVAAALTGIGVVIGLIGPPLAAAGTILAGFGAAVAAFATGAAAPFIAGAVAIGVALYALYEVYKAFKPEIDSFVGGVVEGFRSALSSAVDFVIKIAEPFRGLVEWYAKLTIAGWSFTASAVKAWFGMWQRIGAAVVEYGGGVLSSVVNFGSKVWGAFGYIKTNAHGFWFGMWDGIKSAVVGGTGFVTGKVSGFAGSTIGSFKNIASGVVGSIDKWLQSMGLLPKGMSITGVAITALKSTAVGQFASALLSVLKFKNGSIGAFNSIGNKIKELIGWITDIPNKIGDAVNSLNVFGGGQPAAKSTSGGATVNASTYKPGGGGMEGKEVDARGKKLTQNDLAVAIPGLALKNGIPYLAEVRITNPRTGKTVNATVRDTGPLANGRELDVTTAVAKKLDFNGLEPLKVELIKLPPGADPNKSYTFGKSTNFETAGDKWLSSVVQGTQIKLQGQASDPSFLGGIGKAIGDGFNNVKGFFGGGYKAVASPIATKSIVQIIKDVVPGLGNKGAPRPANSTGEHNGTDFNGPAGTPVAAPHDGVAQYENRGRYGSAIVIKSLDGTIRTVLLHVSDESKRFFANGARRVQAGEQVGTIGTFGAKYRDGTITGSKEHVHVEMRINGKLEDPAKVLRMLQQTKRASLDDNAGVLVADGDLSGLGGIFKGGKPVPQAVTSARKSDSAREAVRRAEEDLADIERIGVKNSQAVYDEKIKRAKRQVEDTRATLRKIEGLDQTARTQLESLKDQVNSPIRDRDRANAAIENNVLGGASRENGDQAILSNKIKYNDELQKSIPLIKAFKAAASSREDIRAAEDLLDLIAKNNAETISANKGDKLATVKLSIDSQLAAQSNRSEDINNSLLSGDINQLEAQRQQLANRQLYNDELQKTLQILEYIRSISTGDAVKLVDEEIRRVNKNDAETKAAATEFRKVEVTEQITKIDRIIKTGEQRQTAVKDDAILNPVARNSTSFLDPNVAIEKQQAQTMLIIRQQTAKQLQVEIELLKEKRELAQNDPAEIERINEKIASSNQYILAVKQSTEAQKEADRAASVAGQATKQINEQLGVSFKDLFTGIFSGAQSINSIFDNLLNKIADIGINAIFNQVFGDISGKGTSGGILDGLMGIAGQIFGYKEGGSISDAPAISNYSSGGAVGSALGLAGSISAALKAEGAGSKGRVVVANTDEYILNPTDTKTFKMLSASGEWSRISQVGNYASGGMVGSGIQANSTRSASFSETRTNNFSVTVDRINNTNYVSLDQVQAMIDVKLPLAAQAGSQMATNNLSNTAFRQANAIR